MRSFSSPARRLLLVAPLVVALGCGGGGSGASAVIPNPASIDDLQVTPSVDGTVIQYTLTSPDSHPMTVDVAYSEDRGLTYQSATISLGALSGLPATPDGVPHQMVWEPTIDLSNTNQSDLLMRLIPRDEITDLAGTPAHSSVFGLGTNTAPQISSVVTPTGTVGGDITVSYTVSDAEEDVIALQLECSVDGGSFWDSATPGSIGSGTSAVPTSVAGVTHTVSWLAQLDSPDTISSTARLRITPVDVISGVVGETLDFSVNLRAPKLELLSLGDIPETMNGSTTYVNEQGSSVSFHLSVPTAGFTFGVQYGSMVGGGDVDPTTLQVSANRTIGVSPPGTNLGPLFSAGPFDASWTVPAGQPLELGEVTFLATVQDEYGNVSDLVELPLTVVPTSGVELPFEVVDRWWLDFTTDYSTITFTGGSTVFIQSTPGGNGIADYEEDLYIIGLRSLAPTEACTTLGSNAILLEWLKDETLGRLRGLYGGSFDGSAPGYAPNLEFSLTSDGYRSAIRVGGDDANPGFTIGRAQFDYRNAVGNDDRSATLGVFPTNIIEFYINTSFTFRSRFDVLIPGRGTPAGEDVVDHILLDPSFDRLDPGNTIAENLRYDQIYAAVDAWARSVAVVLSHEIGHSVGLCANGVPPVGLFGGVSDAPFSGVYTNNFHFDSSGHNVMAAALSFSASLITGSSGYRFNELNQEYLNEANILGN